MSSEKPESNQVSNPTLERSLNGALGSLALGARLGVRDLNPTINIPGSREEVITYYRQRFPQVTLLATLRDLFTKIGSDFDQEIHFDEVEFETGIPDLPRLPHSGVGAWGASLSSGRSERVDHQWRYLMVSARNAWLDLHRSLYLRPIANVDGSEEIHSESKSIVNRLFAPKTAQQAIKRTISDRSAQQDITSLLVPTHASKSVEGLISLYLFPTFGTYQFDWAQVVDALVTKATGLGCTMNWNSNDSTPQVTISNTSLVINPQASFGKGPHVELMNAELQAATLRS